MNKKRPANMVVSAMLATIIFIIIANCFMNLWGNSFTTLTAAKTATQAQAYSDIVSEKIKLEGTDAEEVTTKTKLSEITGNDSDDDWFYTYEIENETEDDNGNVFKVASIKIYKDDENSPRYSTEIPLSSLGNFQLCDGTNGTPDLRGRVIIGTGTVFDEWGTVTYKLGTIGGERLHKLTINEMPKHSHKTKIGDGYQGTGWIDQSGESYYGWLDNYIGATGGDQPHNVMQPYVALYWVMRIK
ncbi:hypothetical protein [Megamonas sp.]|uniref:phage baseplate protein n=1 Tax=Megamonas sp. TaxID=2049033 RepID=UPI00257D4CDC|nr:hypothetical protein [Megamonas sp.]MBS5781066.1 hypothetical protein [Megamonas sp.]